MLLDLTPLRQYRDYRLLFTGQIVSYLGSMISYVAVPYQVYELTKSSLMVGLLGTVQLVPVLVFGLLGGAYADRLDRRKLLLWAEMLLCLGVFGLFLNATLAQPKLWIVFVLTAFIQSVNAFHRPAMEAMTQNLVQPRDYPAVAALGTLKSSTAAVVGPALGGVLIASFGIRMGFFLDFCTFFVAMTAIFFIRSSGISAANAARDDAPWASIGESLRFAFARPQLVGTYVVDIVAMTFAFPTALFPAMAEQWGGAPAAGILFSSMAVGSLLIAIGSGWTSRVRHHGRAVVIAALLWAVAMVAVGFSPNLWTAAFFLALAGAADSVSGIFRMVIWNQTIPNDRRGKLAGLEMISYMTGPLLGNMRAGWMAGIGGVAFSIYAGGLLCVAGVAGTAAALPKFWSYQGPERKEESL